MQTIMLTCWVTKQLLCLVTLGDGEESKPNVLSAHRGNAPGAE